MFTCPRCGSHAFTSTTYTDGTSERQCAGRVVEHAMAVQRVRGAAARAFAPALPASLTHARACTFCWKAADDEKLCVTAEELAALASATAKT